MSRIILLFASLSLAAAQGNGAALEQQRALFVAAEQALESGRAAEARQIASMLSDYPLQPYLLYRILSRLPEAEADIPAFLERYGQTRYADPLRKQWLERLAAREAWSDYLRYYRETENVQAQCNYFLALHRLGRSPEAQAGAERLWAEAEPATAACGQLYSVSEFTTAANWKRFRAALRKNRTTVAGELLGLLPKEQRETAELWLRVHGEPALLEQCLVRPRSDPDFDWLFAHGIDRLAASDPWRAQLLWNLRRGDFRIASEEQARLDRRLGLALAVQRYPQAAAYLRAIPDAVADERVRAWRVRSALIEQDWPAVLAALGRLTAAERSRAEWRYWRARAFEGLGDSGTAAEIFRELAGERDFFGFIGADRVHQTYPLSFATIPVAESELQALAASEPFRAVGELRALDRPGEAQQEWMHAIRFLPQPALARAARLAAQWGWHRLAILTLAKAGRGDDLALRFPLAYSEPVLREARERRIDPAVIYGIIRRESAFDPGAQSAARAMGLMQLLPSTGELVARQLGEPWKNERSLLHPGMNVRFGTAYLRGLLDRFGNHLALAAAGYNAGPGRVNRWLPAAGTMAADIWIEAIPFDETRGYVGAVLSYAVIYRERLGISGVRISDFLADIGPGSQAAARPDQPIAVPSCQAVARH